MGADPLPPVLVILSDCGPPTSAAPKTHGLGSPERQPGTGWLRLPDCPEAGAPAAGVALIRGSEPCRKRKTPPTPHRLAGGLVDGCGFLCLLAGLEWETSRYRNFPTLNGAVQPGIDPGGQILQLLIWIPPRGSLNHTLVMSYT